MEFDYKAKDETGRTVTGVLEASDEDGLADLLDDQNLFLLNQPAPILTVDGQHGPVC